MAQLSFKLETRAAGLWFLPVGLVWAYGRSRWPFCCYFVTPWRAWRLW